MFTFRKAGPLALAGMCAHCAAVPDMPPDYMLPVRDIVLHAACELRTALHEVNKTYPGFDAAHWAIGITLTPKVDTEVSLRAGLTGKSTSIANPGFFNSWIIGSGPGAEYDSKGHKAQLAGSPSSLDLPTDRARPATQSFRGASQTMRIDRPLMQRLKISGACTMSHLPFPYDDIWDPVLRVIDAFGLDRCMWGTDWTRTIGMLTYEQGVAPFRDTKRLSESDKAALMGGTLQKVYKW